jgi:hypothetical protein
MPAYNHGRYMCPDGNKRHITGKCLERLPHAGKGQ